MTNPTQSAVDYSKLTKDELFSLLCPPAPAVTDRDVRLARGRYVVENLIADMMTMAEALRFLAARARLSDETPAAPGSKEEEKGLVRVRHALADVDRFYDCMTTTEEEVDPWDSFASHFDKYHKDGLTSMHGGDCTAIACTCERCYAEHLFDVPSSAAWGGKHAGARVFGAYMRAVEAEKQAAERASA